MKNKMYKILAITSLAAGIGLYQSSLPVYALTDDAEALVSRIELLPLIEDLDTNQAVEVKTLMSMYAELSLADRTLVTNYDVLEESFNHLVKEGILTNEDNSVLQEQENQRQLQSSKNVSNNVSSGEKDYTFSVNEKESLTIMMRYTSDLDGDGQGDVPSRIILVSPDGKNYPISNTSTSMSDGEKLSLELTWTDLYLQLDFAKMQSGKWSIETSQPVTFQKKAFAGNAEAISSVDDEKQDEEEEVAETPRKKKNPLMFLLVMAGIVIGGGLGIKKFISVMTAPGEPEADLAALQNNGTKPLSDEENLELLRQEYRMRQQEENELEEKAVANESNYGINKDSGISYETQSQQFPTRRGPIIYDDDEPEEVTPKMDTEEDLSDLLEQEDDTRMLGKREEMLQGMLDDF